MAVVFVCLWDAELAFHKQYFAVILIATKQGFGIEGGGGVKFLYIPLANEVGDGELSKEYLSD